MTNEERLLKAEHDAWFAAYKAKEAEGINDYNIMMGNIEDPREYEEDETEVE